jgi:hypothetical protein
MQADPNNHFSEPIESSMQLPTITGGGKVEVWRNQPKIPVFKDSTGKLYIPIEEFMDFVLYRRDQEQDSAKRDVVRLSPLTGNTIGRASGFETVADTLHHLQRQAEDMPSAV